MAGIETAIRALLIAESDVTDLVSTRIYPNVAPQEATRPFVIYDVTREEHFSSLDGYSNISHVNLNIVIWSESYSEAKDIGGKVRLVLLDYSGTSDTIDISWCRHDNSSDTEVWKGDGSELPLYGIDQEWRIAYLR